MRRKERGSYVIGLMRPDYYTERRLQQHNRLLSKFARGCRLASSEVANKRLVDFCAQGYVEPAAHQIDAPPSEVRGAHF